MQPGDVILVFEQHAQGVVDRMRGQLEHVELHQRLGPVDRLGDAGKLEEIHPAQLLDKTDDLARQALAGAGRLALEDLEFARRGRIVDPVVEAAALQRVVDLAGAVRSDYHDRRLLGADRPNLGNCHLEIGKQLQQVGLKRLVGAVELVDQQHGRALDLRLQRLQQRPFDQKPVGEDRALDLASVFLGRLGEADLDHLARIVPLVDRRGDIETLVALQADEPALQCRRQHLGDLGLAHPGLAFEKQRPLQMQRQVHRRRQAAIGDVIGAAEQGECVGDGGGQGRHPAGNPDRKKSLS